MDREEMEQRYEELCAKSDGEGLSVEEEKECTELYYKLYEHEQAIDQ